MFEGIAKRKLEKDLAQMLEEKGITWFLSYKQVKDDLLQKHPTQQYNIEALYQFLVVDGWNYFDHLANPLALSNPAADKAAIKRVSEIILGTNSVDAKTANWATLCWVNALAPLSPEQRAKFPKRRAFLISCWQVAFPNESAAIQTEAKRVQEMAIKDAQAQGRAQAARLVEDNPQWPIPKGFSWGSTYRLGGSSDSQEDRMLEVKKYREEELKRLQKDEINKLIQKQISSSANTGDIKFLISAEIWRRIQVAPNQAALHAKLKEAAQVKQEQALIAAEQQRIEQQRQQKLQVEANKIRQVEIEKENKLKAKAKVEAAEFTREVEKENRRLAAIQKVENERRKQQQARDSARLKIEAHRQKFPLECAGISDEAIWEQIKWR